MKKRKNVINDVPAIILAGGFGTRIRNIDSNIPKSLVKVGKYNILEHNILHLKQGGIKEFVISIGYKGNLIKEYFGDGENKYGVKLHYVEDPYPLGDAGAFKYVYAKMCGTTILANSDEIRKGLNLEEMLEFHIKKKALSTMAVIEQLDPKNHGIIEMNRKKRIIKFLMNPSKKETDSYYANSGLYLMEKEILNYFPNKYCMMKNVLKKIVDSKKLYGFIFEGEYFNVGTPEILEKANKYFKKLK